MADFDVFISHASEDKEAVAAPLARALENDHGLRVWIDTKEIRLGDSIRRRIESGLARSTFGVVVLSRSFFAKEWPQKELDALAAREDSGVKVVLPVWHGVSRREVERRSPIFADRLAVTTEKGIAPVASAIAETVSGKAVELPPTPPISWPWALVLAMLLIASLVGGSFLFLDRDEPSEVPEPLRSRVLQKWIEEHPDFINQKGLPGPTRSPASFWYQFFERGLIMYSVNEARLWILDFDDGTYREVVAPESIIAERFGPVNVAMFDELLPVSEGAARSYYWNLVDKNKDELKSQLLVGKIGTAYVREGCREVLGLPPRFEDLVDDAMMVKGPVYDLMVNVIQRSRDHPDNERFRSVIILESDKEAALPRGTLDAGRFLRHVVVLDGALEPSGH